MSAGMSGAGADAADIGFALQGVRVLDILEGISGPFATRLMAGYGADVVKVERPGKGDPARTLPPFASDIATLETSGTFLVLNQGKRSLALDWESERGRDVLLRLLADADVLVLSQGEA